MHAGSELGSRYRIDAPLGEGGMGSVYKAYDRELDRFVAIKVIRSALMSSPEVMQRFKQELLLGSKISHKNILRIHDLGEAGGLKFISMAYVEGEDLHAILEREHGLPLPRALGIFRQVAEALSAAHAEGVVHRDLKPQNILIDRSGTAFVSDFGLAKSLASVSAGITRAGELLGTPRYMAPEQVERPDVDHRADLYALGLILYELVTGEVPFRADSAIQELLERVRRKPLDPRTIRPDLPAPLADITMRCLERNPDERYQSAGEILAALDAAGLGTPSGPQAGPGKSPLPVARPLAARRGRSSQRRILVYSAIGVGVLVAVVAGVWALTGRRGLPPSAAAGATAAARRNVVVIPFRVLGSEEQLRHIAVGAAEMLSSKLFQIKELHVASARDLEQAGSYASAEEAGRKVGANLVVEGTVQAAGSQLRFIVSLHDIPAKLLVWTREFTGKSDDLFALQDDVYAQLVQALKLEPGAEALARAAVRPTQDVDAYDLYLRGRNAMRQRQDPTMVRAAVDFFEQALKKDGRFALAQAGLADASLLMYGQTKDGFWAQRAQAAAQRARDLDETLPEVHVSLGSAYAGTGKYAEAVVELKRALELAPNSDDVHRRLGLAYRSLGRNDDAIKALLDAVNVNPYFWQNYNVLGGMYRHVGDYAKALDAFRRVTELEPGNPVGYENTGSVYFGQGRWEECIPAYQKALSIQPHWLTYSNLGGAFFYLKRYQESVQAFEKAAQLNANDAITTGNLADALRWSGQPDRAREVYATAIALASEELKVNPRDATMLGAVALYYAKSGDVARAREFIGRARAADSTDVAVIYYEGIVLALAGREAAAFAAIDKALAGGYSAREAAADPELQRLSANPEFARLIGRYSGGGK